MQVQNKMAFFMALSKLIRESDFIESGAQEVLRLYERVKTEVPIKSLSLESLRKAHMGIHGFAELDAFEEIISMDLLAEVMATIHFDSKGKGVEVAYLA